MTTNQRQQYRSQSLLYTDRHGRTIRKVPLDRTNSAYAKVLDSDYQRILRMGGTGAWFGHGVDGKKYVRTVLRTAEGAKMAMVARLIVGAQSGGVIRYVDGDPTDLTPENIVYVRRRRAA
jgi:hypothetical protein